MLLVPTRQCLTATSPQCITTSHEQLSVLHLLTFKWIISFSLVEPLTCCRIIAKGQGCRRKVQEMEMGGFMKRIAYVTDSAVQIQRTKKYILTAVRSPASVCICKECRLFFRNYIFLSSCDPEFNVSHPDVLILCFRAS